jgi:putative sugar O-methyltransferase
MKKIILIIKRVFVETNKGLNSDSEDLGSYIDFLEKVNQDNKIFENFRDDEAYKGVVETVRELLARKYYEKLIKSFTHKQIYEYCSLLNSPGNPELTLINGDYFSNIALRYLTTAFDIKTHYGNNKIRKIVELGVGFGGQAIMLNQFFNIDKYTFVDLKAANLLTEKFLSLTDVSFEKKFCSIDSVEEDEYDLFISNFGYSELPKKYQKLAHKKFIKNSKYGYMIVNNYWHITFRYFTKLHYKYYLKNLIIEDEIPRSNPFNKVLIFSPSGYSEK